MTQQEQEIERKKQKARPAAAGQGTGRISGYTAEDAKQIILEKVEKDCRHEASRMIKEIESQAKEEADEKAKNIITGAIRDVRQIRLQRARFP